MMQTMRDARGDLLISHGGDGTAAAVAAIAREQSVPFLALPGGTMNLLMQALYGSDDWQDCLLRGLATATPRPMTVRTVSDTSGKTGIFLVGALFGKPTRMSEAREELRDGHVVDAARGAVKTLRTASDVAPIQFANGDGDYGAETSELVNTVCPFMDGQTLNPEKLGVTLFEKVTGGSAVSIGVNALLGDIRRSETASHIEICQFRLRSDHPIEALLDGEPETFDGEVTVRLDPSCGTVMAPWPAMSFPKPKPSETETRAT
ncbi:MAG: diacylglycerol kinase family protein [Pseudomonadota bacterium]